LNSSQLDLASIRPDDLEHLRGAEDRAVLDFAARRPARSPHSKSSSAWLKCKTYCKLSFILGTTAPHIESMETDWHGRPGGSVPYNRS
jgi:hypothetical protein